MTITATKKFHPLSPAKLEKFRNRILEMAADQAEQAKQIQGVLSAEDSHVFGAHQEWGTDTQTKSVAAIQQDRCHKNGVEIERALERIRRGVYGKCAGCQQAIELVRLEALPITELCCACSGAKKLH